MSGLVGCGLAAPEDSQRRPAQRHEDHTHGCWHSDHDVWEVLLCQGKAQGCALHACSMIQGGLSAQSNAGLRLRSIRKNACKLHLPAQQAAEP